jgi:hypothetical protein
MMPETGTGLVFYRLDPAASKFTAQAFAEGLLSMSWRAAPDNAEALVIQPSAEVVWWNSLMRTGFGGARTVDMIVGEQLPQIC